MKVEQLTEGWVVFERIYCKDGYIDKWMGDMINNPNNKTKSQYQLNAFAVYFRFSSKNEWINAKEFWPMLDDTISKYAESKSSDEIYNMHLMTPK